MVLKIKKATVSYAEDLRSMILKCMGLVDNKKCSKKQISAMQKYWSVDNTKKYLSNKNWNVFIAIKDDEIKDTISFENGVIFSPFVSDSNNFYGGEIGNSLLNFTEKFAKKILY